MADKVEETRGENSGEEIVEKEEPKKTFSDLVSMTVDNNSPDFGFLNFFYLRF